MALTTATCSVVGLALVAKPASAWLRDGQAGAVVAPAAAASPSQTPAEALDIERLSPSAGTYGTGIVVRVRFDRDVPAEARAAATGHITITTTKPIGPAGWAWVDASDAVYRPKAFWPAGTEVSIRTSPSSEVIPTKRGSGLRWVADEQRDFTVGRSQVITVDSATHTATVVRDGVTIRTMPVSLGRPGWETRSGIKVLMESYKVKEMTGASINAEEDYTLQVPYAIRLTDSGEFMHAAPWATANLGRVNGSHGCTNLGMADAAWLFAHHLYGDPVVTRGTGRQMEPDNGAGGVWNVAWSTWHSGRA